MEGVFGVESTPLMDKGIRVREWLETTFLSVKEKFWTTFWSKFLYPSFPNMVFTWGTFGKGKWTDGFLRNSSSKDALFLCLVEQSPSPLKKQSDGKKGEKVVLYPLTPPLKSGWKCTMRGRWRLHFRAIKGKVTKSKVLYFCLHFCQTKFLPFWIKKWVAIHAILKLALQTFIFILTTQSLSQQIL